MWEIPTVNAPYRKYFYTYNIQRSFHFGNNEMKAHSKIPKTYGVIWKSHKRCLSHPNLVLIIVLSSSTDPVNLSGIYGRILQKDCLVLDIDAALYRIDTAGVLDNTKVDNRSVVLKLQGSLRIQTWSLTFQKFIRHYHLQDVLKKEKLRNRKIILPLLSRVPGSPLLVLYFRCTWGCFRWPSRWRHTGSWRWFRCPEWRVPPACLCPLSGTWWSAGTGRGCPPSSLSSRYTGTSSWGQTSRFQQRLTEPKQNITNTNRLPTWMIYKCVW